MVGRTSSTMLEDGGPTVLADAPRTPADRGLRRLPHGRHGLSRRTVENQQRGRILRATVDTVATHGYERTCVDLIISAAGVSRRTFYHLYQDKEDSFLAAHADAQRVLLDRLAAALAGADPADRSARLTALVAALLDAAVEDPAATHVCLADIVALGAEGLALREVTTGPLREAMAQGEQAPTALAAEIAVGGFCGVVRSAIRDGWVATLPDRLPDLVDWVAQGRPPVPHICCGV